MFQFTRYCLIALLFGATSSTATAAPTSATLSTTVSAFDLDGTSTGRLPVEFTFNFDSEARNIDPSLAQPLGSLYAINGGSLTVGAGILTIPYVVTFTNGTGLISNRGSDQLRFRNSAQGIVDPTEMYKSTFTGTIAGKEVTAFDLFLGLDAGELFDASLPIGSVFDTVLPSSIAASYFNFAFSRGSVHVDLTDTEFSLSFADVPTSVVPIPAALPLLISGIGLLGVAGWRRRNAVL